MILLTHCAGNIYIFSFTFVSQFPAFFRSNYAKFLMCVCVCNCDGDFNVEDSVDDNAGEDF